MNRMRPALLSLFLGLMSAAFARASDPPHDGSKNIQCTSCHKLHNAPGGTLTTVAGNSNLCISCHVSGGLGAGSAGQYAFAAVDQAIPTTGKPASVTATGTSHRWDSSAFGRVSFQGGAATASTGAIASLTPYTGPYPKAYTITITTGGAVGAAQFSWTTSLAGAATITGVATGASVALDQGVLLKFTNGATGTSFQVGDKWFVYVRPEIVTPANASLRLESGRMMCSSCHDQHLQANLPFDKNAPASYTAGVTTGRHFQRIANDQSQMCVDCHAPRNITAKGGTSHPVSVALPATPDYKTPATAVLDRTANRVQCQSCHDVHKAPVSNGLLLRAEVTANALCNDCHTYATAAAKGVHFDATLGVLWPGGQYGTPKTDYPAQTARAACINCHQPHGWVDTRDTTKHYANLLVDEPSNLCLTCHDGTPQGAAPNVQAEIIKTNRHPIERTSGRMVACADCHNPHKALKGSHTYATTATSTRNAVSNVLKGVDGVTPAWGAMWTALPLATSYTTTTNATYEYQICFKCHTGYSFGSTPPNGITTGGTNPLTLVSGTTQPWTLGTGTAKFTSGSTTVAGTGTSWTAAMVGKYIHVQGTSNNYRITAVGSATSLTLSSFFTQTTTASVPYETRASAAITATTTVTGYGTTWTSALVNQFFQMVSGNTNSYRITAAPTATSLTIATATTSATPQDFYLHPGASFTNGSAAVTGYGTAWTSSLVGNTIQASGVTGTYTITAVTSPTTLTLSANFTGTTGVYRYLLAGPILLQETDLTLEFNPANRSGHPVTTGLNNYTGSAAPKALAAGTLKAPWNVNVGAQTMMCSDCHNTDGVAAQGPHGSAAQFMLKGANPGNWPNVTLGNAATSWCASCHTMTLSNNSVHSIGNHTSRPCYNCHVVIPHGSKRSRLIGDRTNMPARYAYNNDLNNMQITQFAKKAALSYGENSCGVGSCYSGHNTVSGNEVW